MNEFNVKVSFTFEGIFKIQANDKIQAREYAEKHCGMTESRGIHSSLPDDSVDWEFPVHPVKKIISIK